MKRHSQWSAIALVGAAMLNLPGNTQGPAKVATTPRLEPIAETRLLMEGLAHANFRGLERKLAVKPTEDQTWIFARGQALLIAETANLLMLRPPKTQGQTAWFERATELRTQATALAQDLGKKDFERGRAGLERLAATCNRCHQSFRVPVDIVPFQQPPEPGPMRKVDNGGSGGNPQARAVKPA